MIDSPVRGAVMRAGWLLVLGLVFAGCFDDLNANLNGDVNVGDVGDEPEPAQPAPRAPGQVVIDAEPDAGTDGADDAVLEPDAGPPAFLDTPCEPAEADSVCAHLAAGGECWAKHTEPGKFAHDMYERCTFECGEVVSTAPWAGNPGTSWYELTHEQDCWDLGGTCEQIGNVAGHLHCVSAN